MCSSFKFVSVSKPTTIFLFGCEISVNHVLLPEILQGFYITNDMSVKLHIKNICMVAYSKLHHFSTIWHFLSVDFTKTLMSTFVLFMIDYCNL